LQISFFLSAIRDQGVSHCFIDLGGLNDHFMPALTGTKGLRTIVAAFEGGAAYMADGYARASNGLGVCFGIGGPGVLNMTTALAAAKADRTPLLVISGEVSRSWEGMGGFQDASGAGINDIDVLKPVTGLSLSVSSRAVAPHHLRHAITHAFTRRSPAHLSVPVDVQKAEIVFDWKPTKLKTKKLKSKAQLKKRTKTKDSDKNAEIIRRGYRAFNTGDMKTLTELFDKNASWHTPGRSILAGDHKGRNAIFAYFGRLGQETRGTFKAKLLHVLADDNEHVVGIHRNTAKLGGKHLDAGCCIFFELKNGRVIDGREYFYDLHALDEFWS
jgi:thiamine pyrophosphate-dependent acetolactate synthase large subunit-like protein